MHILGGHNVVRFGHLKMWAERGLIHIEDTRDGGYSTVSVRTSLERMSALGDMLANAREQLRRKGVMPTAEYDRIVAMLEQMAEVVMQAREQGTPDNPQARRELVRRRPQSVLVPCSIGL
jgi:hypothetical protein